MSHVSERLTRKKRIELLFYKAGWDIQPYNTNISFSSYHFVAIEEFPTSNDLADYTLILEVELLELLKPNVNQSDRKSPDPGTKVYKRYPIFSSLIFM